MRCMNCGWENPDGFQRCEKCNSPLSDNKNLEEPVQETPERRAALRGTVSEYDVFAEADSTSRDEKNCPKCGYPLRDGMRHCPNCGQNLIEENEANKPDAIRHSSPRQNATVNPWANPIAASKFRLEPVAYDGETDAPVPQSFIGDVVELNRNNTEPANNTITSKAQAEITREGTSWILQDKSSQGTTFIQAKRRIALENGDVVMLGNRKFIFKAE